MGFFFAAACAAPRCTMHAQLALYFTACYGSLLYRAGAFALDAHNQIAVRAIGASAPFGGVLSSWLLGFWLLGTAVARACDKKIHHTKTAAKLLRNTTKTTRAPPIAEPGVRPRGKEARRQTQRRGPRVLRAVVGVTRARVAKTTQAPPPPPPLPPFVTAHITISPLRH